MKYNPVKESYFIIIIIAIINSIIYTAIAMQMETERRHQIYIYEVSQEEENLKRNL